MLPNVPQSRLYTEARQLTDQLADLIPGTVAYQVLSQRLHVNQTAIHTGQQAVRDLSPTPFSKP